MEKALTEERVAGSKPFQSTNRTNADTAMSCASAWAVLLRIQNIA